jgi:hypothetical protein
VPTFEAFNVFKFKNILYSGNTATNFGNPGVNERTGEVLQPSNPNFLRIRDANGNYLLNNRPGAPLQIQVGVRLVLTLHTATNKGRFPLWRSAFCFLSRETSCFFLAHCV